jgi:hypothetical protein
LYQKLQSSLPAVGFLLIKLVETFVVDQDGAEPDEEDVELLDPRTIKPDGRTEYVRQSNFEKGGVAVEPTRTNDVKQGKTSMQVSLYICGEKSETIAGLKRLP